MKTKLNIMHSYIDLSNERLFHFFVFRLGIGG